MNRARTYTIDLDGLPTLRVSGEPQPPEFACGVPHWTVDAFDVAGAAAPLTPEQECTVDARLDEIESHWWSALDADETRWPV